MKKVCILIIIVLALIPFGIWFFMFRIPGKSYKGPVPLLTEEQKKLKHSLQKDVEKLASEIGERNVDTQYENLCIAADFIETSFRNAGYEVHRQGYEVSGMRFQRRMCYNLEIEVTGLERPGEIVVIGAHYDAVENSLGANDNASGVAALLALARAFVGKETVRTLRFVAFANEESPYFQTENMGSIRYAKRCRGRMENVVAMISLETIGYYTDTKDSQQYPISVLGLLYPDTGNFLSFVSNFQSRKLMREVTGLFRKFAKFPSEAACLPITIPGIGWSDQYSFWMQGYPAVMVTDTALFRYPYYHTEEDTSDKITYHQYAYVVSALESVLEGLVGVKQ